MEQVELLRFIIGLLERLRIPHMVVGSYASSAYGEPRFTQDIDIVIDPQPEQLDALIAHLPAEKFYVSREAAIQALRTRGQFNIIDPTAGLKIDLMISRSDAWGAEQLRRRTRIELIEGMLAYIARPEDIALAKMLYYKEGASDKHLRDIASMFRVNGPNIDRDYIQRWSQQLGVDDVWNEVKIRIDA